VDPLISYTRRGLFLQKGHEPTDFELEKADVSSVYLWDSQLERRSAGLVDTFLRKQSQIDYQDKWSENYTPALNDAMDHLVKGDAILDPWRKISELQLALMPEMIPPSVEEVWKAGVESGRYFFKLCGAGGGGFYLVYQCDVDHDLDLISIG